MDKHTQKVFAGLLYLQYVAAEGITMGSSEPTATAKNWAGLTGILTAAPLLATFVMWAYVGVVKGIMKKPLSPPTNDRLPSRATY